jgi:hypothetical protein
MKPRTLCACHPVAFIHSGRHRWLVDPECPGADQDFERLCWKSDSHGDLLKDLDKSELLRTHVSDVVGCWVVREHTGWRHDQTIGCVEGLAPSQVDGGGDLCDRALAEFAQSSMSLR